MLDHRNDEAPAERYRDADVDLGTMNRAVTGYCGIDDGMLAQILGTCLHDERQERQVHAAVRVGAPAPSANPFS